MKDPPATSRFHAWRFSAARRRAYNPGIPLSLAPGSRVGVYEIVAAIGAGGMGEV